MAAERLWVCHRCKLIGNGFEAGRHVDASSHPVEQLSVQMSDAVREAQRRQWPDAADLIAYASFMQKAGFSGSR